MDGALSHAFDLVLALAIVGCAVVVLHARALFTSTVLFIAFGLLVALAWARLGAVDLAIAEAAIGAGLTGALFLQALPDQRPAPWTERHRSVARMGFALIVTSVAAMLAHAVTSLPREATGLRAPALEALEASGVEHPVTAVLLGYRAYDTLLEIAVLLLAVVAAWSVELERSARGAPSPVLRSSTRALVPLAVLVGGYLLWRGTHAPGGAFQAGAVLAGVGVLSLLGEAPLPHRLAGWPLRLGLAIGVIVFAGVGLVTQALDGYLLAYRGARAGALIVAIELAATVSIALALTGLFAGRAPERPAKERSP